MSEIKRFSEEPNEFGDYDIVEDPNGEYMLYGVHAERIKQLEQELAAAKKDQARYKFVRDMPLEDFGNLSTINDEFDCQIDAAIAAKESSK